MASGIHSNVATFESEDYGSSRVSKARGLVSRLCANLESHTKGEDEVEAEDRNKRNLRYYKGKSAKEKRKLREKRRSTGVVNLNQESTSTGDEVDDEEEADDETMQNTTDNTYTSSSFTSDTTRNGSGYSVYSNKLNKESNRESDEVFVPESRVRPLAKISSISSTYSRRLGDPTANSSRSDDWRTRVRSSATTATSDTTEIERLKQELEAERSSRLSVERELQQAQGRITVTEQRLTDSQEQLQRSQQAVAALTEELNTLNQDLDDIEEDNLKLAEANRALMQKLGLGSS